MVAWSLILLESERDKLFSLLTFDQLEFMDEGS